MSDKLQPPYVKFLQRNMTHHGFTYKEGLNIDTNPFSANGSCSRGGLYFTNLQYASNFKDYGPLIADVELPKDAKVYWESANKAKADRIVLKNIREFSQSVEAIEMLQVHHAFSVEKLKMLTEEKQTQLILQHRCEPQLYLPHVSETVKIAVVQSSPGMIAFLADPSEAIQRVAVEKDPFSVRNMSKPSETIQMLAVSKNPETIGNISNPTEAVQLAAVTANPVLIRNIKNATFKVQKTAVQLDPFQIATFNNPPLEMQLDVVRQNGLLLKNIQSPSVKVQEEAVEENPMAIAFITAPSISLQLHAVEKNPRCVYYIKNPAPEVRDASGLFPKEPKTRKCKRSAASGGATPAPKRMRTRAV